MNENKAIKVLMVGPGRNVKGGISSVVNSYYALGLDRKVELKYITSMEDGNKLRKLLVAAVSYLNFCRYLNKYDIVHIHMAAQASFTRKSFFIRKAKAAGKKIIIHQHGGNFDHFFLMQSNENKRKTIRTIFAMADKVIVLAEEWDTFFSNNICDSRKIVVLHNSVMVPNYQKQDYSDHNVLFLGRLEKEKGIYDLLRIVPDILKVVPDAVFFLGGDGDIEQCRSIVNERDLNEHVRILGWILAEEKEKYFKKSSIFILPSYYEGMPMAVLEAMSYGLATISTNTGGIPQIIDEGINGFCVEAGDLETITDRLELLLASMPLRKKLGQEGRKKILCKFNAKENIDKLQVIYQEVEGTI